LKEATCYDVGLLLRLLSIIDFSDGTVSSSPKVMESSKLYPYVPSLIAVTL